MSDTPTPLPNPVLKGIEANQKAEAALTGRNPHITLSQSWASIAANWFSLVDPKSPEVRIILKGGSV